MSSSDDTTPRLLQKHCSRCRILKPIDAFNHNSMATDGHNYCCRACQSLYRKAWYNRDPKRERAKAAAYRQQYPELVKASRNKYVQTEHYKARTKELYKKHAVKNREKARLYRQQHLEQVKSTEKKHEQTEKRKAYLKAYRQTKKHKTKMQILWQKYYEKHAERLKARAKVYAQRNAVHIKERTKAYRQANAAHISARTHLYHQAHPEVKVLSENRRRAQKQSAPMNDFTATQWEAMQVAFEYRCAYCHKRRKGKLTQDHITPLSKGGSHTLSNIVPACKSCNSRKHAGPVLQPVQPLLLTLALQR